jgi:hypothetical protein
VVGHPLTSPVAEWFGHREADDHLSRRHTVTASSGRPGATQEGVLFQTMAPRPVMARPTISVFTSRVPS